MRKKILLVDDTVTVTAMERIILGDAYDYWEARNGQEAVARALADGPDLILMDLNMPVMDGMAGLRALKAEPRTANIPVVIVSTRGEADSVGTCRALGCADFVTKPIDRALLRDIVKKLLGETT
jgi:twitching motility two-component system response regulator PilH